jgi:Family of unknown function (DUF5326)
VNGFLNGVPWWVKWVAVPVIALFIFGGLIASIIGFVVGLLFKVLLFAALVGGLVFLVKRFTSSSSSSRKDW